ncbi:hypothetical protein GCM10022245_02360 [Streptomyces mayteni]
MIPTDWNVATNNNGIRATRARDNCARYTAPNAPHTATRGANATAASPPPTINEPPSTRHGSLFPRAAARPRPAADGLSPTPSSTAGLRPGAPRRPAERFAGEPHRRPPAGATGPTS